MALLEVSEVQAVSWEVWGVDSAEQVVSGGSVVEGSFPCDRSFQMVFFLSSLFDRLNEEGKPVGPSTDTVTFSMPHNHRYTK